MFRYVLLSLDNIHVKMCLPLLNNIHVQMYFAPAG